MGAYEIDFRVLSGSDIRWISARGQGDDADHEDEPVSQIRSEQVRIQLIELCNSL